MMREIKYIFSTEFWDQQRTKVVSLIISFILLFICMVLNIYDFNFTGDSPDIIETKEVDSKKRVKCGIFIIDFNKFSTELSEFSIIADIWFEFDPNQISPEIIKNFTIGNGEIKSKKLLAEKSIKEEGKVLDIYKVEIDFTSFLDHHRFPFDDHMIYLIVDLEEASKDIILDISESSIEFAKHLKPHGWTIAKDKVKTGYTVQTLDNNNPNLSISHPRAIIDIELLKPGIRQALLTIGPSIILFFFGLMPLTLIRKESASSAYSNTTASLTGLVLMRLVVETVSPVVGYLTIVDYLYIFFITVIFCTLVILTFESKTKFLKKIKTLFLYSVQIVVIMIFYYFLWIYYRD